MPRRNKNVGTRNVPRAAQPQRGQRTQRAQLDARQSRGSARQPSALDRADHELALYTAYPDQSTA